MRRTTSILMLVALAGTACRTESSGAMVAIAPPDAWQRDIVSWREQREQFFRSDPESPLPDGARAAFDGLDWWAPDPAYYFVGQVHAYLEPERFEIVTTRGERRPCAKIGWIAFPIDGREVRLQVYRLLDLEPQEGGAGYFLPFQDATTGSETYAAGRYVELSGPEGGPFVLDFNTATNPFCAYGAPERYACPVTPRENRLSVRIEAGERGFLHVPALAASDG